jgi:hypothetical protein
MKTVAICSMGLFEHGVYITFAQLNNKRECVHVGMAERQSVAHRHAIQAHKKTQAYGQMLSKYLDASWELYVYSLEECEKLLGRKFEDLSKAEEAMIKHFCPICNTHHNGSNYRADQYL